MKRRQLIQFIAGLGLAAGLISTPAFADEQIKIGVTAGPHAEIMEQVKKIIEKDGVQLKVIEFTDYIQPNAALSAGDLDAKPGELDAYERARKFVDAARARLTGD